MLIVSSPSYGRRVVADSTIWYFVAGVISFRNVDEGLNRCRCVKCLVSLHIEFKTKRHF